MSRYILYPHTLPQVSSYMEFELEETTLEYKWTHTSSTYPTSGMGHMEELEGMRAKLQVYITESEVKIDAMSTKITVAKKTKLHMELELEEISLEYERTHTSSMYPLSGMGHMDELEGVCTKLQAHTTESEEKFLCMESELEEMSLKYERTHATAIINEKWGEIQQHMMASDRLRAIIFGNSA